MKCRSIHSNILVLFIVSFFTITTVITVGSAVEEAQVSFPYLFNPDQVGLKRRIHIVSESFSDEFGYETLDEYLDLDIAKQTLITTNTDGKSTYHTDALDDIVVHYKSGICSPANPTFNNGTSVAPYIGAVVKLRSEGEYNEKDMHLLGVTGLWWKAGEKPKFEKQSIIQNAKERLVVLATSL